ncbi:MAG: hypothetical protein U0800_07205 [Isosphaeraceae bacterium]
MVQAMTSGRLSEELEEAIRSGLPLRQIVTTLRLFRRDGVTRQDAQLALEELRNRDQDDSVEDRILEVMDIVSGFCSRENTVWDD